MADTVVTSEPETAHQEHASVSKMPSVETFKEIVMRHCHRWHVESVENLCPDQTQSLIDELASYFV